jgi:PAS domain S-box-containing protein
VGRAERSVSVTTGDFGEAFDEFPDGLSILRALRDESGTIVDFVAVYANAALERISGMRIDEIVDHRLLDFVPAFRDGGPFDAYREVVDTGVPWEHEVAFDGAVGSGYVRGIFEMRAVRLGDGILVTYRDVTSLRRAQDAVRRMAAIVESTDDAIVGADRAGLITHWNPGAERLLGYEHDEIVGQPVRTLVLDEDFPTQNERFSAVLAGNRVERIETQWVRKDGGLVDVVLTASPMLDRDAAVIGASAVVHDITARKRDEAELRRSHAELERFADIAAHDLREPLMAISQLTMLLERGVDSQREEIVAHLRAAAAHGCRLVDGLLDLARIGRGMAPEQRVDLRTMIEQLLDTLAPQIEAAGARIEVGPLPTVRGVEGELARVFQNLLVNALKFRGAAPPVIEVSAARGPGEWTLTVRDNGPGVSERNRERVFDLFARGHSEDAAPGNGLGLAVCRKVVELHGGRIWVEPAPGGGSAFRLTLPA